MLNLNPMTPTAVHNPGELVPTMVLIPPPKCPTPKPCPPPPCPRQTSPDGTAPMNGTVTQTEAHHTHALDPEWPTVPIPARSDSTAETISMTVIPGEGPELEVPEMPVIPGEGPEMPVILPRKLNLVNREEATRELAMCDPIGGGGCVPPGTLGTEPGIGIDGGDDGGALGGIDGAELLIA